jgi:replicative DNA helicase
LDAPGPVWLCPGELKALAVVAAGRSAVGVTGGEGVELPDELPDMLAGRPVAVVADDDAAGRKWERAALDTLRPAGLDVRPVDLGLSKPAGLKDIGDVLRQWAVDDAREPEAVAAGLDAAYERSDPWRPFTIGAIWSDRATWGPVYHVPTGLRALDDGLGGGLRVGGVHLIVGKSGRAKTTTATQVALSAARAGVPVGFVSLEMTRRDVAHLLAANLGDIPRSRLGNGKLREDVTERLRAVLAQHGGLPLTILDDAYWSTAPTRSALASAVADGCRRFGWRLVALDYLGLLGNEPSDGSEYTADLENSAALKRLARVQDVALLVVAALRKYKRADAEQATTLDDVLGAGRLAYDAVNVLDVDCEQAECEAGTRPTGLVRLRPLKTRFSGLATPGRELHFRWFPGIGRITDMDAQPTFDRDWPEKRQAERQVTEPEQRK